MPSQGLKPRIRRAVWLLAFWLPVLGATPASAQTPSVERTTTVSYLAGPAIYVKAGRDDGLEEGQQLSLIRSDSVVATLVVQFLSSRQASCTVVRGDVEVVVGDTVRFTARAVTTPATPAVTARAAGSRGRRAGPGLHGRVGARYLVAEEDGPGGGFRQPSFDLRLDGVALGGTPLGLALDLRTRRTTSTLGDGSSNVDGSTRVYRASLSYHNPGSPLSMTVGRQYLSAVTAVSLFDGGLVELRTERLAAGLFGGTEPTPSKLGLSSGVRDAGAYLQVNSRPQGRASWSLTAGGVGSYQAGAANREFGFLHARVNSRTFSIQAMQELDYYRPWKVDLGETRWSLSSSYVSASLRPARWLTVNGAWDTRRRVRLYRDATDPALAFDDAYRQGVWGGVTLRGRRVWFGGDARRSTGGSSGEATAWTTTGGIDRLTSLGLRLSGRATWYRAPELTGRLLTGRLAADLVRPVHMEVQVGTRVEDARLAGPTSRRFTWWGGDLDVTLARAWYLSLSGTREQGPDGATTQFYSGLTWRF